jgi:hypothetical protein
VQRAKDIWVNWIVIGLFVSATAAPSASAQDLAQQTTALREIRETVAAICYTVQQQGSQSNAQLSGDIQVKLNSVFSKLGDLGFTGSAQLNMQQYQGVPQQDLASTLRHSQDCKKDVFDKLLERMLPSVVRFPLPPHPQPPQPNRPPVPPQVPPQPRPLQLTKMEVLGCAVLRERVIDYELAHREIAGFERIHFYDRCQSAPEDVPPPQENLRIVKGNTQYFNCVHLRDEIIAGEAPNSPYVRLLDHDLAMWRAAYCDRTDPPLAAQP